MNDVAYESVPYRLAEIDHRYGEQVHILADPLMLGQLAVLCQQSTTQPQFNDIVRTLYRELIQTVVRRQFPRRQVEVETRMSEFTDRAVFCGEVIDGRTRAVTVNLARAGTLPSQLVFDLLSTVLDHDRIRQDHIVMNRATDAEGRVTGTDVSGSKIGGDVKDAFVLFPDPMGATGGSMSTAFDIYTNDVDGPPRTLIAMNLIVTPEYIRRLATDHPDASIYTMRLDRGMSSPEVLATVPGERWDEESGLTDKQYIVPGGGGFGELMNNSPI